MFRAGREPISKPGIPHEDDTADGRNARIAVRLGSVFCCASTRQCEHCRWRSRIDCRESFRALGVAGAVTLLLFRRHLWHLGLRRVAHEEPGPDLRPDAHSRRAWPARALLLVPSRYAVARGGPKPHSRFRPEPRWANVGVIPKLSKRDSDGELPES